ncbi:sigma intracellular receptor 2 [Ricinus communis]|uniref:EXPERA domain-containing protein n=1 Tax=Ricinus communis TaxID=3988 RepID=B9SDV7_RICCO|nr:sigma intracellular receptor 2 [Ricinus communis]EEF38191.1 conserved hypothetical protein [Ricinus communis]|eukprot:XP_002524176.1 sigma intracellular receptor 2 [Ricinus communis]
MGAITKLIDAILFFNFLVMAMVTPLIDSQTCLPANIYPDVLINARKWYSQECGDYLYSEMPHFFVGMVWIELLFHWPLVLSGLYGISASKSWVSTTCLIYGTSVSTCMVAVLAELLGSGKALNVLLMNYYPSLVVGILAILRGLMPCSAKAASATGGRPAMSSKKRA